MSTDFKLPSILSSSRNLITLGFLVLSLSATGAALFFMGESKDDRSRAQTQTTSPTPKPEYAPGEIIIKFKPHVTQLRVNSVKEKTGLNLDKDEIKFTELDQAALPSIFKSLRMTRILSKVKKVFQYSKPPPEELAQLKQKFAKDLANKSRRLNEQTLSALDLSRTYLFTLNDPSAPIEPLIEEFTRHPDVAYAEPNFVVKTTLIPNDPYYSSSGSWGQSFDDLYGLKKIAAPGAWDQTTGSNTVIVADIDTGIDRNHPDLTNNMWTNSQEIQNNGIDDDQNGYIDDYYGWDYYNNDKDPIDDNGHGTHTAGTIAAVGNNAEGVVGVSWNTKLMAVKFLSSGGYGYTSGGAKALYYAANNGAHISSNSWGGSGNDTLKDAISYEHAVGMTVVVAAGNSSADAYGTYPAGYPDVITIAASDYADNIASFSNYGEKIDLAAPGVDILSTRATVNSICTGSKTIGNYCRLSGTSMATPHVAGLAALLKAKNNSLTNEEIRQLIRSGADDLGNIGKDTKYGYGRTNANNTLLKTNTHPLAPYIITPTNPLSGLVQINGTIPGPDFTSYTLEIGEGSYSSSNWKVLTTSTTQVIDGVLFTFDSTIYKNTTYLLRLTAYITSGEMYQFQIRGVTIQNIPGPSLTPTPSPTPSASPIPTPSPTPRPGVSFGNSLIPSNYKGHIETPVTSDLVLNEVFAVEAWVKLNHFSSNVFFAKDITKGPPPVMLWGDTYSGRYGISAQLIDASENYYFLDSTTPLQIASWYHVVLSKDHQTARLFIDGHLEATSTLPNSQLFPNTYPYTIGSLPYIGFNYQFDGQIDEFRISRTPRYTTSFPLHLAPFDNDIDTLLLYHFDDTTGATTVADSSSYRHDGSIVGTVQFVPSTITDGSVIPSPSPVSSPSPTPVPSPLVMTFTSVASEDGYVTESGETTNVGGSLNSTATSFRLGDDASNKQYKGILSFDTSLLPDNASITQATLKIRRAKLTGTDPFTTHKNLVGDIQTGKFGKATLEKTDFETAASVTKGVTLGAPTGDGTWSTGTVKDIGLPAINLTGRTQFRLYFTTDDNNDKGSDYLQYNSGEITKTQNRPSLEVGYEVP